MNSESAAKIIENYHLIHGKLSRKILNAILKDEEIMQENLPAGVNDDQIKVLRKLYKEKLTELKNKTITHRYLPFYYIIKDHIPSFIWNLDDTLKYKRDVHVYGPRVKNLRPSLLSLLLGRVAEETDTLLHRKYQCVDKLPPLIVKALDNFMKQSEVYYPPEKEIAEIVNWLLRGLNGDKLTIFVPLCPDYAADYTGNPRCPVNFSFNDLGCGNGIIAQWLLSPVKNFADMLEHCHIQVEFIVAMADFEAFSEGNLKKFGITKEEFLRRVYLSAKAFKNACPINANVIMFTDLCNESKWSMQIESIKKMFAEGNYGLSGINRTLLLDIVQKRKPLYCRWYGEKQSSDEYIDIALDQGMMYAAMGIVLSERYKNCLVFAADNKVMRYFYSFANRIPTLYINKKYS
jgi:hypothetical protein